MSDSTSERILHITYARQDEAWVHGVLIPALRLEDGQYWTRAEDNPGALKLEELERAVLTCPYTLLVASSAASVDDWVQFAAVLAQHLGLEGGKPRLLVATRDFEPGSERAKQLLPLRQQCLVCLDCSDAHRTNAALGTLAEQLQLATTVEITTECPYPGLRMFGEGDTASMFNRPDLFFGRSEEGSDVIERLRRNGRVLLVGPSGCGKSSLVRALVLPALGRGPAAMEIAVARPGGRPHAALHAAIKGMDAALGAAIDTYLGSGDRTFARAALAAHGGVRRLLYLDQFEEVFLDDTPDGRVARASFFDRLSALGCVPDVAILLGMRADFYGDLMRSSAWDDFKHYRVELAPLRGTGLRLAITRPAEMVGVHVEADLVERLVREADEDRASEALPLLQVALEQLWAQREWRYLSLASFDRLSGGSPRGLDVVLARHADASIMALDELPRLLARRTLIDLVHLGDGRPDTRRRRFVSELRCAGDDHAALTGVLDHLSARRLVVIGAEMDASTAAEIVALPAGSQSVVQRHVDLAHDTLITGWPALARWINDRRDDLRTQRRLEERARSNKLLSLSELPEFIKWLRWADTVAGKELGTTEQLRRLVRRSAQWRRFWIGLALAVVTTIVLLSVRMTVAAEHEATARKLAEKQAKRASEEAKRASEEAKRADSQAREARRLLAASHFETGRRLLLENDRPLQALPYLLEARKLGEGEPSSSLRMLFGQASRSLPVWTFGHAGAVFHASYSPDGMRVVTASEDKTARVWDVTTGQPASPPLAHQGVVRSVAFSPDGTRVVTASEDKTARVWDATTGQPVSPLLVHQDVVWSAAFSPDGARVVTASQDHSARVWDATSGRQVSPRLAHRDVVWSAAFSPDGTRVVTASQDHSARVWDATSGRPVSPPLEHQKRVNSATFSPDGARVLTASWDQTARVWDATSGRPVCPRLTHRGEVVQAAFSPDATRVVTASTDRTARVWDATTGRPVSPSLEHQGFVESAAFSSDGTRVVTASWDKTARVWDAATGSPVSPLLEHRIEVVSAAFSPDGMQVVTASWDKTARVWDATSGRQVSPPLEHQAFLVSAAFSSDGTRVLTASHDNTARVWDATSGRPVSPPLEHHGEVLSAAFSPDGTRVVTASVDKTARVWDATTGRPLLPPIEHPGWVRSAAFSPDGMRLVTASDDMTARVWDAASGRPVSPPLKHQGPVWSAAFSPDGTRVVTASGDKTARVWDATTGRPMSPPLKHQGDVIGAAFSPDGARIVTASQDYTARVWDATSGRPVSPPFEHQNEVRSAAFSPDGMRVVTSSHDQTARVWDVMTGRRVSPPLEHKGWVLSAAFSPDGTCVVTASFDKTARVWDVTTGRPVSPPLGHRSFLASAAFSPDGTRVVTASFDKTARVWSCLLDSGSMEDWNGIAARDPYTLVNGTLVYR